MLSPESYQLVIEKFMKSLRDGTLKQGDKIYSEHQLARILGIPRAQVREVYAALSVLGILYGQQGKGTFLSPADMSQHSKILYLMTLTAGENFQDVVTVRRILETGGAALGAVLPSATSTSPVMVPPVMVSLPASMLVSLPALLPTWPLMVPPSILALLKL